MWAQCPGITVWDHPPGFRRIFPKHPSTEILWPGLLCLGVQSRVPLAPQTNTAAAQLPMSWSPVWGAAGITWAPLKLRLPPPWSPRPGLRLLKRLQPPCDLILLLFSSAPPWGPARPPKKPRPALGDHDPCGVGGEGFCAPGRRGAGAVWGFSGVAAGVAAPRNNSPVCLSAPAAPSSCWDGFSRP